MKKLLYLIPILFVGIAFAKYTSITGGGGGAAGAAGAAGPAGAAGSSIYGQRTVGGSSTPVNALVVVSPNSGQTVGIAVSSFTLDLSSFSQTAATETFSGGRLLLQPTTMQVSLMSPHLRLLSMNAYPMPLILGNNAAGTLTGIGFGNTTSSSAFIGYISNTNTMLFGAKGNAGASVDWLTYDGAAGGGVSFGTKTLANNSVVAITTGAGYTGQLLNITTGPFSAFRVNGDSVVCSVPLISRYGVEYATSSSGGGGGVGVESDPAFATFISTLPKNAVTVGSMTALGTVTSTTGFVGGGSTFTAINIGGAGPSSITPVTGVLNVLGDMAFPTTWYTGVAFPSFTGTSTMTVVEASTVTNGRAWMDGLSIGSAPFNAAFYQKKVSENYVVGSTPSIRNFTDYSSGTVTQDRAYLISFASAAAGAPPSNLIYTSTVVYVVSGSVGSTGGSFTTKTRVQLPGVWSLLGSGECVLWIRIARDGNSVGDPANSNSAPIDVGLAFRVQQ